MWKRDHSECRRGWQRKGNGVWKVEKDCFSSMEHTAHTHTHAHRNVYDFKYYSHKQVLLMLLFIMLSQSIEITRQMGSDRMSSYSTRRIKLNANINSVPITKPMNAFNRALPINVIETEKSPRKCYFRFSFRYFFIFFYFGANSSLKFQNAFWKLATTPQDKGKMWWKKKVGTKHFKLFFADTFQKRTRKTLIAYDEDYIISTLCSSDMICANDWI